MGVIGLTLNKTTDMENSTTAVPMPVAPHNICPMEVPSSSSYLKSIYGDREKMAIFAFFGALVVLNILIYIYEIVSIRHNKMPIMRRIRMVILLSLYPVFSLLAFLAITVPRAAPLLDLVANVYFSVTLWHFIQLMLLYYGGETKMIETMSATEISIQVPPLCCVFFCLPKYKLTKRFLRVLKLCAAQFLVVRPILLVISMILWVEDKFDAVDPVTGLNQPFKSASTYISLVNIITTLLAVYPLVIIFRASISTLGPYHIRGKFVVFQLVMILGNLQDSVFTQLANFNFISCSKYLPVGATALEYYHLCIIGEMFVIGVAALAVYWRYIRENIPLNSHFTSNGREVVRTSSRTEFIDETLNSEDGSEDLSSDKALIQDCPCEH